MKNPNGTDTFYVPPESALRPTWTVLILCTLLSGATLGVLPFFDLVASRDYEVLSMRDAPESMPEPMMRREETAPPPRPPPPPPRRKPELEPTRTEPRRPVEALRLQIGLELSGLSVEQGDFSLDFEVDSRPLGESASREELIFEMPQLDAPPRPLSNPRPDYPPRARRRRIEGFVELEFVITAEGDVADVRAIRADPEGVFESAAIRAVSRWRFTPPLKEDVPVMVRARQVIRFEMH